MVYKSSTKETGLQVLNQSIYIISIDTLPQLTQTTYYIKKKRWGIQGFGTAAIEVMPFWHYLLDLYVPSMNIYSNIKKKIAYHNLRFFSIPGALFRLKVIQNPCKR